jgi:hypothetical protein
MRFHSTLFLNGKTATGIRVPDEVVAGLGSSKRPAVRVTLGSYTYRTTIAPMGGEYWIPVAGEVRERSGVKAGDELDVDIELDTEPREVTVPPDFAAAIAADANSQRFFDGLSYSNKRRLVMQVEEAKTAETRQRRIARSVEMLREGRT